MKPRKFWSLDVLVGLLALCCVVLAVLLCVANPRYIVPAGALLLFLLLLAALDVRFIRRGVHRALGLGRSSKRLAQSGFAKMGMPVVVLEDKKIVWYNDAFGNAFEEDNATLQRITKLLPGLNLYTGERPAGQDFNHNGRRYTAYAGALREDKTLMLVMFVEDTALKASAEEYYASRPAVLYIELDTYEEAIKQLRESERSAILAWVNTELEDYIGKGDGFIRKINSSRYLALVQQRQLQDMMENRFPILDKIRSGGHTAEAVTLSIGVGCEAETFARCEDMAQQALDMALGRGGDQAAVRNPDGFTFFGGVSRSMEKRSRVKSRTVASAIRNLAGQCSQVLVMGHKQSDMDSVGAAVGMLRFGKMAGKPSHVVIHQSSSMAGPLIQHMVDAGCEDDFLAPDEAMHLAGPDTLLVIVDTHVKYLLESEEIYKKCGTVVVVDHHRKMVEHVDNAVVFYHEPYASSASELVSELLLYADENTSEKPTAADAEALLAGIMLDTRTFSLHVGVRTFEAAAYLRRLGAKTENVKTLFASSLDDYVNRSQLVAHAELYGDCAVVMSEGIVGDVEVVVAQAANDLLGIEGIKASFVAVQQDGMVRVSARSMGDINVQVILEKLGGGGHLTMAGAQVRGATLDEVHGYIFAAIDEYRNSRQAAQNEK